MSFDKLTFTVKIFVKDGKQAEAKQALENALYDMMPQKAGKKNAVLAGYIIEEVTHPE